MESESKNVEALNLLETENFDHHNNENIYHHNGSDSRHRSSHDHHTRTSHSHRKRHRKYHRDTGLVRSLFGKLKKLLLKPSKKVRITTEIISVCLVVAFICLVIVAYVRSEQRTAYLEQVEASRTAAEEESKEQAAAEEADLQAQIENLSVYEKLTNGYDVNILIVGDSIGAASGASDSAHRWTVLLETYLEEQYGSSITLTNISMGGNTSFAGYVRTMILKDDIDYDLAVICYGQNDSTENFSMYYEAIITAIKNKYENCSIISILESSQKGYTEKMKIIEEICNYYSIPIADTIDPFLEFYNFYTDDGTHPNDDGQVIYAETVERVVDKQVAANVGLPEYDLEPLNAEMSMFANCDYISSEDFVRTDDTTYTISITASGIFGIDYSYQSGENSTEIYVDGELFAAPTVSFSYDFSQRHILVVSDDCMTEKEITIVFESEEQADRFYGICFCYE